MARVEIMNCRFQIVDCGLLREGRADYGKN